ncbi:MAG: thiol:disulfide interchange protein, partial [Alphaproteobacteria bacterium]|nr:thiol:disulfide interchange protein [Alphaproteobacteria bacterium]
MIRAFLASLVFALLTLAAGPAAAQLDPSPKVAARLVAESGEIAPGGTVAVALEEVIRPGWHTYWVNPGDAGLPSTLAWQLPAGWQAGGMAWPYPKQIAVGPV